jgi:hypothetical protein
VDDDRFGPGEHVVAFRGEHEPAAEGLAAPQTTATSPADRRAECLRLRR